MMSACWLAGWQVLDAAAQTKHDGSAAAWVQISRIVLGNVAAAIMRHLSVTNADRCD
jgi:hypothetical protein